MQASGDIESTADSALLSLNNRRLSGFRTHCEILERWGLMQPQ
ncbi:hypothetical protein PRJ_3092 [Pseudomonas sp. XWY-1]|nr:hypothetical protein PRJ_3092 [Pseudomonas sp. XWY-1]